MSAKRRRLQLPEGFTNGGGTRKPTAPPHWPFGNLTEAQMRERALFERHMRSGELLKWPESQPGTYGG